MYSFNPIASIPASHDGFYIITTFCIICLVLVLFNEPETFFVYFFLACIPFSIAYGVSYHWTNQEPKVFANTKVTAEFVGFQPEGYREKSGKSMVDKHYMYVVYRVNGNDVILQAQSGTEYPKTAILYKN
jgi:hypothetical protein